jgi:hypothetical protein
MLNVILLNVVMPRVVAPSNLSIVYLFQDNALLSKKMLNHSNVRVSITIRIRKIHQYKTYVIIDAGKSN